MTLDTTTLPRPERAPLVASGGTGATASLALFWLACLLLPMPVFGVGSLALSDVLLLASLVLTVLSSRLWTSSVAPIPVVQVAAGLIVLGGLTAALHSADAAGNFQITIRVIYCLVIWQWQSRVLLTTPGSLRLASFLFACGAGVSGFAAAAQLLLGVTIPGNTIEHGRAPGLALHVNGQGGTVAVALALSVGLLASEGSKGGKRCLLLAVAGQVSGAILASSLSGIAAGLAGVLFVLVRRRRNLPQVVAVLVFLGGLGYAAATIQTGAGGASPIGRLLQERGAGVSTVQLRQLTDEYAWQRIKASPLVGAGLDTTSGETYDGQTATHNVELLYWYQGGLPLLLAFLLVVGRAVAIASRTVASIARDGVIGALIAALVVAQSAPILFDRYFWFPIVLLYTQARVDAEVGDKVPAPQKL